MVVVTDSEDFHKKALLTFNSNAADETLPAELSLIVALPDVVHLGKSLKCSWANWYIELEGAKSNLVLIRTLRDCGSPDIHKKLTELLNQLIASETKLVWQLILLYAFCGSHRGTRKIPFLEI